MKISVIIPVFNEGKNIEGCINSLLGQNCVDQEIIVVDDGSTDKTREILQGFSEKKQIIFLKQNHLGPGHARNLGASVSGGEILVFVDSDMIFEKKFLHELVEPIIEGKTKGTFSREEYVANWESNIAKFWQYNRGLFTDRMVEEQYQDKAPVFRAILKSEFQKVGGFETEIGYTDDWSLSRKLGYQSDVVDGAKYYHFNPESWSEVWIQASWIGKNEFISGTFIRKIKSLMQYNLIASVIKGIIISARVKKIKYLVFQVLYDFAVLSAVLLSFFIQNKIK